MLRRSSNDRALKSLKAPHVREQLDLLLARQPLERELQPEGVAVTLALPDRADHEWPPSASVTRAPTAVMHGDARRHVTSDAAVERAVVALGDVHVPKSGHLAASRYSVARTFVRVCPTDRWNAVGKGAP